MKKSCFIITLLLLGCQAPDDNKPSNIPFLIEKDTVVLHKTHIISVKTELYQPSFELHGIILPKNQTDIIAPQDGIVSNILVKKEQSITKNTPVLTLIPPAPAPKIEEEIPESDNNTPIDPENASDSNNSDTILYNENNDKAIKNQEYDEISNNVTPFSIIAPINGTLKEMYIEVGSHVKEGSTLMTIYDESMYHFVSTLPKSYEKHLRIGQGVQFTLKDKQIPHTRLEKLTGYTKQSFAGQVASLSPQDDKLSVMVHVLPSAEITLFQGLQVGGRINYGDLDVGVLVPSHAITDGTSLKELHLPPHKPATPLSAKIWVIRQDGTLSLAPVHVVAYKPETNRYLVSGISQDSLIATANLPDSAHGKKVVVRSSIPSNWLEYIELLWHFLQIDIPDVLRNYENKRKTIRPELIKK